MTTLDQRTLMCRMIQGQALLEARVQLDIGHCVLEVGSNSRALLDAISQYFRHFCCQGKTTEIEVIAIESGVLDLDLPFKDWPREPGKTGRKECYFDCATCRVIRKVRSGMLFLQAPRDRIAVGPCLANFNQLVNFINSQVINRLLQRNWLLCHCAAVVYRNFAIAVAARSGGGKSTWMLELMNDPDSRFLSNDRLLIQRGLDGVSAAGIAKQPRINPGTALNNSRLQNIVPAPEKEQFLKLSQRELWATEHKYDVDIEKSYGSGRIKLQAPLKVLMVLNWDLDSDEAMAVKRIDLQQRRDLLSLITKSPGPFYQDLEDNFLDGIRELEAGPWFTVLAPVPAYEVRGGIDFKGLTQYFYEHVLQEIQA